MNAAPHTRLWKAIMVIATLWLAATSQAGQFRSFTAIPAPDGAGESKLPRGAEPVADVVPVPRAEVEKQLRRVIESWNQPSMSDHLAEEFYDRTRLLDNMNAKVPRDATLEFQALESVRTLQQYRIPRSQTQQPKRVSIVSATARTQIQYTSPETGFEALPGINEFILRITRPERGQ